MAIHIHLLIQCAQCIKKYYKKIIFVLNLVVKFRRKIEDRGDLKLVYYIHLNIKNRIREPTMISKS